MKTAFLAAISLSLASPIAAADFYIDGTHGESVYVGDFAGGGFPFEATLVGTTPTNFSAELSGLTYGDTRFCSMHPEQCTVAMPISFQGDFTATGGTQTFYIVANFFCCAFDGVLSFFPTDGATVHISVAGRAVPEPISWLTMLGGFGFIGGALRQRNAAYAKRGPS